MRIVTFVSCLVLSCGSQAAGDRIRCEATPSEGSFRLHVDEVKPGRGSDFVGLGHSFRLYGALGESVGCRTPWYEKFVLFLNRQASSLKHSHQYVEGCYLHVLIPVEGGTAFLWVDDSPDGRSGTDRISSRCRRDDN